MKSFEGRRKILLRQMLIHTCIGHPMASLMCAVGCDGMASDIHYATLPARAKRRLKRKDVVFSADVRLRFLDVVITPLCSVARAFGFYELADWIFRHGPHEVATELGSCHYEYSNQAQNGYSSGRDEAFRESRAARAKREDEETRGRIARQQRALEEEARVLQMREELLDRRLTKLYNRERLLEEEELAGLSEVSDDATFYDSCPVCDGPVGSCPCARQLAAEKPKPGLMQSFRLGVKRLIEED